jgi:hypothetical protein
MLGAYAYGYDLARDPIIGVQPIEYMLTLDKGKKPEEAAASAPATWSLLKSDLFKAMVTPGPKRDLFSPSQSPALGAKTSGGANLRRLMTPLSVRGMSQAQLDRLSLMLRGNGLEPMMAMGGGADASAATIEPGSVLGAAVLTGDLEMAAIGTCTEVVDGRVYGFGHPFMGEGATSVPMGAGAVNLVMPVLTSSFKLGSVGKIAGAIDMDGNYGIAGEIGAMARTFPIEVEINDESISRRQTFHYDCAVHPSMSAQLTGAALESSLTSQKQLPLDHTIDYTVELKLEGGHTLNLSGVASSVAGDNVPQLAVWPAMLLANNPFQRVNLAGVRMTATIRASTDAAEIVSASPNLSSFKPGETVVIHLRLKPYRGEMFEKKIEVELPAELEEGDYSLSIADASTNLQFEVQSRPNEFAIRNVDELISTLEKVVGQSRADRLFVRLSGTRQNMAIGRTALMRLPASKRAILEAAARPDTAAAVESSVKLIEMNRVVAGSADVVIHVVKKLP